MKQKVYVSILILAFLFFDIIYSTTKNLKTGKSKKSRKSKNKKTLNKAIAKKTETLNKKKQYFTPHTPMKQSFPSYSSYCINFF